MRTCNTELESRVARLFDPLTLRVRGFTLRDRVVLSPMCQYSAEEDGRATDWHLVHLGGRAVDGAEPVLTEDAAVPPEGRITRGDLGLWDDAQVAPLRRIADFVHARGAAFGVQFGHAGRKGSTTIPWQGGQPRGEGRGPTPAEGAWTTLAPSALAFGADRAHVPSAMTDENIARVQAGFVGRRWMLHDPSGRERLRSQEFSRNRKATTTERTIRDVHTMSKSGRLGNVDVRNGAVGVGRQTGSTGTEWMALDPKWKRRTPSTLVRR